MNTKIEIFEVQSVIRLLKNIRPAEIHKQTVEVYGEGATKERNVRKQCRLFKVGRIKAHDKE
jgi:hypothetical protein